MLDKEFFRTSDMAMVTYLKIQGFPVQGVEWEGGSCYWVFRSSEIFMEATEDFMGDGATVNPREFSKIFTQVKREFYDSKDAQRRLARAGQ